MSATTSYLEVFFLLETIKSRSRLIPILGIHRVEELYRNAETIPVAKPTIANNKGIPTRDPKAISVPRFRGVLVANSQESPPKEYMAPATRPMSAIRVA